MFHYHPSNMAKQQPLKTMTFFPGSHHVIWGAVSQFQRLLDRCPPTTTLISLSGIYLLFLYCLIYRLKVECRVANEMMEACASPLHSKSVYGIDYFWHAYVLTSQLSVIIHMESWSCKSERLGACNDQRLFKVKQVISKQISSLSGSVAHVVSCSLVLYPQCTCTVFCMSSHCIVPLILPKQVGLDSKVWSDMGFSLTER